MRLVIVSHVVHYKWQGNLWAYGPYAREIELWADLFTQVIIASPLRYEAPARDCLPFEHANISISPQLERGGGSIWKKLQQILSLPRTIWDLCRAMYQADVIHIRCPGNIGLLGALLAPFFARYRIAKYAGQWPDYPGEAFSYKLQKKILKSSWFRGPVTVYGKWPNQPKHIIPFFTSITSESQMRRAIAVAQAKQLHTPIRILFVGRLSFAKNVHILIDSLKYLFSDGIAFHCRIVGDGPERLSLESRLGELNGTGAIQFVGGLPFDQVLKEYEWADVLVLASQTEGWPKAIAEAMSFGLVCIGSNRGLVPQMLSEERGILVEPGSVKNLTIALEEIAGDRTYFSKISKNAAVWAQPYTLEGLREALCRLMEEEWEVHFLSGTQRT